MTIETLYEVNWHYNNEIFSHCTIAAINVLERSLAAGASIPSIVAIDSKGEKFRGSEKDYFTSPEKALVSLKADLLDTIDGLVQSADKAKNEAFIFQQYLSNLP